MPVYCMSGSMFKLVRILKNFPSVSCQSQRMILCSQSVSQNIFLCIRCVSQGLGFPQLYKGTIIWRCRNFPHPKIPPPPPVGVSPMKERQGQGRGRGAREGGKDGGAEGNSNKRVDRWRAEMGVCPATDTDAAVASHPSEICGACGRGACAYVLPALCRTGCASWRRPRAEAGLRGRVRGIF